MERSYWATEYCLFFTAAESAYTDTDTERSYW